MFVEALREIDESVPEPPFPVKKFDEMTLLFEAERTETAAEKFEVKRFAVTVLYETEERLSPVVFVLNIFPTIVFPFAKLETVTPTRFERRKFSETVLLLLSEVTRIPTPVFPLTEFLMIVFPYEDVSTWIPVVVFSITAFSARTLWKDWESEIP